MLAMCCVSSYAEAHQNVILQSISTAGLVLSAW
jgi:hypothetical protein